MDTLPLQCLCLCLHPEKYTPTENLHAKLKLPLACSLSAPLSEYVISLGSLPKTGRSRRAQFLDGRI